MEVKNKTRTHKSSSFSDNVLYNRSLLTRSICIPMKHVNKNIHGEIERYINKNYEGKCVVEGYIKPQSVKLISYSSGLIKADNIIFDVGFECEVCYPIEGMNFKCIVNNITKAGLRCEIPNERPSPLVIFVTRDHHFMKDGFSEINEGDIINVKIIGQRFELNDKYISVIAIIEEKEKDKETKRTLKLK